MYMKQKRQGPRLDRTNGNNNIEYDASTSSSPSSSFENQLAHRTRSLDLSPLSVQTSFRIEGLDGEFDVICRSLGLSGPEDFAIPAAAWEARKISSNQSSVFRFSPVSVKGSIKDGLSEDLKLKLSVNNDVRHENHFVESENLKWPNSNLANAKDGFELDNGMKHEGYETANGLAYLRRNGDLEGGIKDDRAWVLTPPPAVTPLVVDNLSSTWDLLRDFGPRHEGSPEISSPSEDKGNDWELDALTAWEKEPNGIKLGEDNVVSEPCSDASNVGCDVVNSSNTATGILEPILPNVRHSIKTWQKGDILGSGSFGTVYEGFTDDGFFFAVKEVSLLDQGSQGKQSIYQLEQEISLLSQFQHENIVQYLGTDKEDSKLYIFLELVTKGSLANLYQKYHLRDSQVSAYTRQILNGLNYLHERSVVHRDIKCANILVDVSGSVKLADFGLAKATKLNDIKSCKGTPFWMAPEVVNNRKNQGYGLAADIWSLGCTVLEMLTRQIPYSHLEGMQALFRIGRGEPPPIPNSLSGDAEDFILKCLQVNPDNRPTAAQLLDHPFVKRPLYHPLGPASPRHLAGLRLV